MICLFQLFQPVREVRDPTFLEFRANFMTHPRSVHFCLFSRVEMPGPCPTKNFLPTPRWSLDGDPLHPLIPRGFVCPLFSLLAVDSECFAPARNSPPRHKSFPYHRRAEASPLFPLTIVQPTIPPFLRDNCDLDLLTCQTPSPFSLCNLLCSIFQANCLFLSFSCSNRLLSPPCLGPIRGRYDL